MCESKFAYRLKQIMEEKGFSQADLAKSNLISKSYLSGLLSGKHPPPDVTKIKALSRYMRLDKSLQYELIVLAGKEIEHVLQNQAAANFLRKTVKNGWDEEDWEKHNQLIDLTGIGKNKKD